MELSKNFEPGTTDDKWYSHWMDRDEQRIDATDPVAMNDYNRRLDVEIVTAKGEVSAAKVLLAAAAQALQDASQQSTAIAEGSSTAAGIAGAV